MAANLFSKSVKPLQLGLNHQGSVCQHLIAANQSFRVKLQHRCHRVFYHCLYKTIYVQNHYKALHSLGLPIYPKFNHCLTKLTIRRSIYNQVIDCVN